jgi:hypothetical protein
VPSKSKKQAALFRAVAHNPAFAKKAGIPQSVGEEFFRADQAKANRQKRRDAIGNAMKKTPRAARG